MGKNLMTYMPSDEVRLCDANNDCIEARGDNARIIVITVAIAVAAVAAYYVAKLMRNL